MGLGKLETVSWEWLSKEFNNMTLGIHSQEWSSTLDGYGKSHPINQLIIGFFFGRITFEFIK